MVDVLDADVATAKVGKKKVKTDKTANLTDETMIIKSAKRLNSSVEEEVISKKPRKEVSFNTDGDTKMDFNSSNLTDGVKRFQSIEGAIPKKYLNAQNKRKHVADGTLTKPYWATMKQETKDKRKARKMFKMTSTVYEITEQAKQLWEKLRMEKGDHTKTTTALHDLLKTNLSKLVFSHEMSRIVQWLLHLGSAKIRASIIEELQPLLGKMLESKYASKCVIKMLKYGSKESKEVVVESFMGRAVKYTANKLAAPVVELGYTDGATDIQKNRLRQEFYSDLFKGSKDDAITCLADIFKSMPQLKDAHLSCTKKNVTKMLEKKMDRSSLFYIVLNDYLKHCSKEDRDELLLPLREVMYEMLDTEAASEIGMQCVIHATNKEKKLALKSLKGHVVKMSKAKYNHKIVLAMIDSIDDTVTFGKALLPEIMSEVLDLAQDQYGRRVVAYLVAHRDPAVFGSKQPELATLQHHLETGTTKKSPEVRQKETLNIVSPAFLDSIATQAPLWFADSKIGLVAYVILKTGTSKQHLEKAYASLSKHICNPEIKITDEKQSLPLVEHQGVNWVLKNLLKVDYPDSGRVFCAALAENLSAEAIKFWITFNRGAFILVLLTETGNEEITKKVADKLKPFVAELKKQTSQGAKLLIKKLGV